MTSPEKLTKFRQDCCEVNPDLNPNCAYDAWYFGDNRELAAGLVDLVLKGRKRATAALAWEADGEENPPERGSISIVTDFDGDPMCVIRFTDVRVTPFNQVDADFAFDEGEGDQSLDYWRSAHWEFFSRYCSTIGREPDLEMPVICKRFEVLYPVTA